MVKQLSATSLEHLLGQDPWILSNMAMLEHLKTGITILKTVCEE
jgi:hypothetical protein